MNYALIDVAQQFHVDCLQKFLKTNDSKVEFLHSTVKDHFYGDYSIFLKFLNDLKKENPSLIYKQTDEFIYQENLNFLINIPLVISVEDIKNCKHIESLVMRLMDRSSLVPISGFSRRRIYLLFLNYFSYIIQSKNIEGIIVFDTPHSFSSHLFFELCKLKKLRIIKMEYHFLTEYSLVLNQDLCPIVPDEFKAGCSIDEIKAVMPPELVNSIYENSKYLMSFKAKEKKAIVKQNAFSSIKLYIKYLDKCTKNLIMGFFPFLFKNEMLHFASLNGIKNKLKYRLILNRQLFKLTRLNILYNKIASKNVSVEDDYVFVGLHMQPEKTSQPMGEEFDNQLMMIKMIADSLPEGWKVFVKEHPNQFNVRKVPNRHYRDKLFYASLQQLKNVVLVPLENDSIELIEKSKMVATLTGTSGWEAITRATPALIFGNAYYVGCKAVRKINSVENCKKAIQELIKMQADDFSYELYRYMAYYYENNYLVHSANWQLRFDLNSNSYESQIQNIVDKLVYFHNKNLEK